jgi:hypothetical protein
MGSDDAKVTKAEAKTVAKACVGKLADQITSKCAEPPLEPGDSDIL